jgi:dolichol-phosphate mannosyltransferase
MDHISVILPTYNEKEAVVPHAKKVAQVLKEAGYPYEIVVVDDNSPDATAEAVRAIENQSIRVIVRTHDRGLGLSIGEGVRQAKGNIIVGMDADGNHDPLDLPTILAHLTGDTKLVVASRFKGDGGMKGWRMLPTLLFNGIFRLFGLPIWDNTSGYYAVRKDDVESLGLDKVYYGYGDYHLRLLYFAMQAGWKIVEVPTHYQPRLGGASKSRLLKMAVDYTKEAWRLRKIKC